MPKIHPFIILDKFYINLYKKEDSHIFPPIIFFENWNMIYHWEIGSYSTNLSLPVIAKRLMCTQVVK